MNLGQLYLLMGLLFLLSLLNVDTFIDVIAKIFVSPKNLVHHLMLLILLVSVGSTDVVSPTRFSTKMLVTL